MPSPTRFVVGAVIGAALVAALGSVAYSLWGAAGATLACLALAYEGWTLVNRWPNDTLSEIVWQLAKRPMVPHLFGIATGWGIALYVPPSAHVYALAGFVWGFLMGHFFFQRQGD